MRRLSDILANGRTLGTSTSSSSSADVGPVIHEPPSCAHCNDAGFVRRDREPGDPDFGQAEPCVCAQRESEEKRQARLQRYSQLGLLTRIRFEALDPDRTPAFRSACDAARTFAAANEAAEPWLLLWGPTGSGRTALAAAMANDRIARGQPALYMVAPDLLDHLRAAYRQDASLPYAQLFEQVRNAPFLILDDLDASNRTAWAEEKLFQLLNHRIQAVLPTVVLTGQDPALLDGTVGNLLARILGAARYALQGDAPVLAAGGYREIGGMTLDRLERFSFEHFRIAGRNLGTEEAENLELVRAVARDWALDPRGWITFVGETGTGKSHLAAAIALERLQHGDRVVFAVVPDLLDHLRRAYSPDNAETYDEMLDALRGADVLVLDDLGAHSTTPWAQEKLYQLFSYRYIQALPTVITTNLNPDVLDARLASRLLDHQQNKIYRIVAPDYRTGTRPRPVSEDTPRRRRPSAWDRPRW